MPLLESEGPGAGRTLGAVACAVVTLVMYGFVVAATWKELDALESVVAFPPLPDYPLPGWLLVAWAVLGVTLSGALLFGESNQIRALGVLWAGGAAAFLIAWYGVRPAGQQKIAAPVIMLALVGLVSYLANRVGRAAG